MNRRTVSKPGNEAASATGGEAATSLAEGFSMTYMPSGSGSGSAVRSARRAGRDASRPDPTDGSGCRKRPDGCGDTAATERHRIELLGSPTVRADLVDAYPSRSVAVRESLVLDGRR